MKLAALVFVFIFCQLHDMVGLRNLTSHSLEGM